MPVGCQGETLSLVTMRREEALESDVLAELAVGTAVEVLEIGSGRRIKIRAGGAEGWVSSKTRLNEPLIVRRRMDMDFVMEDFEVGGQHEVKSIVTLRAGEELDSDVIIELRPGTIIRIIALSTINRRRAKITCEQSEGWISLATKQGELLVGKLSSSGKDHGGFMGSSSTKMKELLEAARSGNLAVIQKIAEHKGTGVMSKFSGRPNLNCSDIRGKTALIYAAGFGNREVVEYLLTKTRDVDVNALDDTQKNALHHASKRAKNRRSPEFDVAQIDIISMLLHAGIFLEARDHNGCTALMFAVANGNEAAVGKLIAAHANVHVKDFEGHTPIDYARNFRHDGVAKLLLSAGATEDLESECEDEHPPAAAEPGSGGGPAEPAGAAGAAAAGSEPEVGSEGGAAAEVGASAGATEGSAEDAEAPCQPTDQARAAPDVAEAASCAEAAGDGGTVQDEAEVCAAAAPTEDAASKPTTKKKEAKSETPKAAAPEKKEKEKEKKEKRDKGEKPGKGKKSKDKDDAPKRRGSAVGMMEAVEAHEEVHEVTVVPTATEEVDEKQLALAKLTALLETSTSPGEIEGAINVARAGGVDETDLEAAGTVLQAMKARQRARDRVQKAVEQKEVGELREAIAEAEMHKVPSSDIDEARRVLAEEEPKERAREQLHAARTSGSTPDLKAALSNAKSVGLQASELKEFEELLAGAESKEKAESALKAAVESKNVANLRLAINQATDAGVDQALIKEADGVLRIEEPKQRAREQLASALGKPTKESLTAAIDAAKAASLDSSEYAEAVEWLRNEEEKEKYLGAVTQVLQEVQTVENEVEALRAAKEKLSDAINAALQSGVSESALVEADARRKKLHNAVEDLKGSIRVYCRVRPLSKKEVGQGDTSIAEAVNSMTISLDGQSFQFDSVWTPGTQEEVFEDCKDLVQSAVDGYNVTMFAYGQTGAGKTFTMYGAPGMEGTSPRTIQEIFRVIDKGKDRFNYTVMGSMLELYRNDLVDLLSKGDSKASAKKLNVRQEKTGMVVVEHLTEEECSCAQQLSDLMERGNKQRTVAATAMNSESSRSHLVLIIRIVSVNKETKEQFKGKILMCDLAGSERLKKSQVEAHMQKEAIEINKSLTALGDVIEALTKGSKVIPYRNHKLTQLMQDALGGTAKTLMFVNCSPANSNLDETLMSLKYATRAKKITNTAGGKKG